MPRTRAGLRAEKGDVDAGDPLQDAEADAEDQSGSESGAQEIGPTPFPTPDAGLDVLQLPLDVRAPANAPQGGRGRPEPVVADAPTRGFRQGPDAEGEGDGDDDREPEHPAPVAADDAAHVGGHVDADQPAAHVVGGNLSQVERADDRNDADGGPDQGAAGRERAHVVGGNLSQVERADDRNDADGGPDQGAAGCERRDIGGQRRAQGAEQEHRGGEQQDPAAAEPVGQRPAGADEGAHERRRDNALLEQGRHRELLLDEQDRPGDDRRVVAEQRTAQGDDQGREVDEPGGLCRAITVPVCRHRKPFWSRVAPTATQRPLSKTPHRC
jgi:hypothetical protein